MTINVLALPNVRIEQSLRDARPSHQYTYTLNGHREFQEVLTNVIAQNPHWDFEFVNGRRTNIDDTSNPGKSYFRLTKVKVYLGKEYLGDVGIEYHGSGEKVYVLNHRVSAERVRNQGKAFTSNPQRAISLINKNFSRKTPSERLKDANSMIAQQVANLNSSRYFQVREAIADLQKRASQFVLDQFEALRPMLTTSAEGNKLLEGMATYQKATEASEEVKMLINAVDNKLTTTVVVLQDSYVVHSGDTLSTFTHDTLPDVLRGPLGMLKLVETNVLLPIGIRVDESVFLINKKLVVEGEKDATQV